MNDHGNCIAQATNTDGKQCVVLLLKVDVEIHDENGNPQIATEENPANVPVNGDFDEEKQTNGRYVRNYEDASIGFVDNSTDLKTDDLRGCVVIFQA
ncbi:hypothetical protein QEH52_12025 [Coraliomargarita sp. SDUM461003]|uniref:Uncharacterized protein n=1 Tax=Thalassobacterium maritimum TaxID=3041265 RepID=A0ABU1AVR5_9BACT|nr:hypothetical protein [Coraliomargarita sp. SDUM461003]MDQ8208241.1 hypothetical protein [Coraliomargarita sp. SDUM461003]